MEKLEVGQDATVKTKRRFDKRDWTFIAEMGISEWERRKSKRKELDLHWKEIDRQVRMEPDIAFKFIVQNGKRKVDSRKAWMSEVEPPLQAQALEVLTADASRLMFGDGTWFRAHSEVTDQYFNEVDFKSLILGDEIEVPSQITQDNADKLVHGYLSMLYRQGDFLGCFDRINAEVFKYGMGIGRARMITKSVLTHTSKGVVRQNKKIPILVPASVKNHYLDDRPPTMHSDQVLSEMHISEDFIRLENLAIAANRGSSDPKDPNGGWMPKAVGTLEANEDGFVQLIELEGDIVVPRKTARSMVLPGAIATIAVGGTKAESVTKAVVRFRWRKDSQSSYIQFPYHYEGANETYPASPLMKGRPIQIMVAEALNSMLDSAALKKAPPVGYDRNDMEFAQNGGPVIQPHAQWGTMDDVKVHNDVGGDTGTLASVLQFGVNLYGELTGVLPARLGAQTVSHTTAFAKDAEIQRGAARTVDYVRHAGKGPIERWLEMSYKMGRDGLGSNEDVSFFIEAYGGYVNVTKSALPEKAIFEWFGSAGPAEEQARSQRRLQSAQLALQMDQLGQAFGVPPTLDMAALQREILREGGWIDIDVITRTEGPAVSNAPASGVPGPAEPNTGLASTALQAITFGGEAA